MIAVPKATIEDLYNIPDDQKAELINGELVLLMPTGDEPNYAASEVFAFLRDYVRAFRRGRAVPDNAGFRVNLPNRESFSPDAAFYVGPRAGMRFFDGAPIFAVEVRSLND